MAAAGVAQGRGVVGTAAGFVQRYGLSIGACVEYYIHTEHTIGSLEVTTHDRAQKKKQRSSFEEEDSSDGVT